MAEDGVTLPGGTEPVENCAECGKGLTPEDRVAAGGKLFCRTCHAALRQQLVDAAHAMSADIPYPTAALGALACGVAGAGLWWGITVLSGWSLGIVAIAVGWAVGWGAVTFSGGKRAPGLQWMSASIAAFCWVLASYVVNRTFINRALAEEGRVFQVPLVPDSLEQLGRVLSVGFGIMDVVFLAIMVWEAWKFPRPLRLPEQPAA